MKLCGDISGRSRLVLGQQLGNISTYLMKHLMADSSWCFLQSLMFMAFFVCPRSFQLFFVIVKVSNVLL